MKGRLPLIVILRSTFQCNFGHLQSDNGAATSAATKFYFRGSPAARIQFALLIFVFVPLCAYAQTWGTITADVLANMNTSTPGTTLTATIANAGTVCGGNCTVGTNASWGSGPGDPTDFTVGTNPEVTSNLGAVQMANGGTLYPAYSLNYNNLSHTDADNNTNAYLGFSGTPAGQTSASILFSITFGPPYISNGDDWDDAGIWLGSGEYYEIQTNNYCNESGEYGVRIETGHPTAHSPGCIPLVNQATYWISLTADATTGNATMTVFTANGTLVGQQVAQTTDTGGTLYYVQIGNNENGSNSGTATLFQNLMVNFSSVSLNSGSSATVTNGSATIAGLTGASSLWAGYQIILPDSSGEICSTSYCGYTISSCSSSTTCTLTQTYDGASTTSAEWEFQQPYFWPNSALTNGIIGPGRVTAWAPGVVGGIPTSRTQCTNAECQTLTTNGASSTSAEINAAIANAPANTYVLLPAGTYSNATDCITFGGVSNVTLRGAGANQTFLEPTSTSGCGGGSIGMVSTANGAGSPQNGPVAVTGNVIQGSTTITLASVPNLVIGNPIILDQLDPTCDNGGIFVNGTGSGYTCTATTPGLGGPYNSDGGVNAVRGSGCSSSSPSNCYHQQQIVEVISCNGDTTVGNACSGTNVTVGFYPGLHMPNWSTANMYAWWPSSPILMDGVEDLNISSANNSGANGIEIENCQGCWVKGVASEETSEAHVQLLYSNLTTIRNNYFFLTQNTTTVSYGVECYSCSDALVENNIFNAVTTPMITNGPGSGLVFGYNFTINEYYVGSANYSIPARGDHASATDTILTEGNISDGVTSDNVHGTANMNTYFRNYYSVQPVCWESGSSYATATYGVCNSGITTMQIFALHRFMNLIGNVLGTQGTNTTYCNGATACTGGFTANNSNVLGIGYSGGTGANDPNTVSTIMLWGNADPVTGYSSPRFNCSEVPQFPAYGTATDTYYGVQFPYFTQCPTNKALPASLYYTSKPSWWPSNKPWPIIGPDITGGNLLICGGSSSQVGAVVENSGQCPSGTTSTAVNGLAYSNPAMDCYLNTMGGPANGETTGALSFNEVSCYGTGQVPSPPTNVNGSAVPTS